MYGLRKRIPKRETVRSQNASRSATDHAKSVGVRIQPKLAPQRRHMRVLNVCWLGKKHRTARAAVDCPIEQLVQRKGMIRPQNAAGRLPPARFRRAGEGFDLGEELGCF